VPNLLSASVPDPVRQQATIKGRVRLGAVLLVAAIVSATAGCGGGTPATPPAEKAPLKPAAEAEVPLPPSQLDTQLPEAVREVMARPFTGDLDELVKRRLVRIGVTFNRTFYFVDKGVQRGIAYEYGRLVEDRLNARFNPQKKQDHKILVFFIPLPRDKLLTALTEGKVDMVAAQVTVRPALQKLVDFTNPTRMNVSEIVVTGPGAPPVTSVQDLSGKTVLVRKLSPYHESLVALSEKFRAQGKPGITLEDAPENLEDDDLLEMVNAGLIPATVVDNYLAKFWRQVFPNMTVHEDVAIRTGGTLAIAIRKNSPQLKAGLNQFMGKYGLGSAFGNQVERQYLVSTKYVKNAASDAERKKFLAVVDLFRKYADQYNMDFLLLAAQGYQESTLNQDAKSSVGAIGVMQLMPQTGKEMKVGDITQVESNIHAGVKYMHSLMDRYYANEPMDKLNKGLFTFAAYNAGPGRINQLRREAAKQGLDPNVWFGNVEQVASERIGRETVTYVSNIYKYYVAYRLVMEERERRATAVSTLKAKKVK
jgi:membrane-bound lytic murein transglycosylase MltF